MGRVRRAIHRLACGECLATGYDPCVNKRTGKAIKGFHSSRRLSGRHDAMNALMRELEGGEDEDLFRFAWEAFGLPANRYPPPGKPYWHFMPELHPDDQYHGSF